MVRTAAALVVVLLASASPAAAQIVTGASATLEMRQSLTVSTARPMAPSGVDGLAQVRLEEGAYQITGDPNRAYRVRTVSSSDQTAPVITSSNAGEISEGGLGRLDAEGRDIIRIALAPPVKGVAPQPIALLIDYE
ncbi:MAG: hypothetical protein V4466_16860 [Pseudomonadota bacterium]